MDKTKIQKETTELLSRGLPKWPQMIVTGKKLTEQQALEIIRRTDTFFFGYDGNNHSFNKQAREILELPNDEDIWRIQDTDERYKKYEEYRTKRDEFHNKWGTIETEYVHNSWISCAFIGGPHGWCHPDGTIGYSDNVGKWPEVEEIYNEWCLLAKEFPFIEVGVTLWNGEGCEDNTRPVVSFKIKDGKVEIVDPEIEDVHEKHDMVVHQRINEFALLRRLSNMSMENAIPLEILKQWHNQIFGVSFQECPLDITKPYNLK